ncbi:Tat (twin-arginine translocation) pathway signal sequence [Thiothrix eikelboomii]|uniref:Tat (Twin-arginine translocation) pathway signal sequence n=1 Tax=Thiothrix eikelboomii TaxID=92487 RepID=A0A1T4X887_9GAMM|nr:DUF1501 domain-containing protein [Thiothrix eikelboomii]SKA85081.1 Tat (twin-arginine translocation) pathway signal sequence [Thiothrix eikelboomii]
MNRRDFLKGLGLSTLSLLAAPSVWANTLSTLAGNRRIVILIELKGGNDGLNTLIPYTHPNYYSARPTIAIERSSILTLSAHLGLNPALEALMPIWNEGELAWVQGIGYETGNRSHFEAIEIWDTAQAEARGLHDGWIAQSFPEHSLAGIALDTNLGPLYGQNVSALSISEPSNFASSGSRIHALKSDSTNPSLQHILNVQSQIEMLASTLADYLKDLPAAKESFGAGNFGQSLNSAYTLIASGLNVPAYKITLGSFDTHTDHRSRHKLLLQSLAQGLASMRNNLKRIGMWDEVIIMTYSEFGRRLKENANKGIDHGAASVQLVMGGKVKGGLYGEYPSLTDLDERGDLVYTTDFRDIYSVIRNNWWNLGEKLTGQLALI